MSTSEIPAGTLVRVDRVGSFEVYPEAAKVRISGLRSKPELNDTVGTIGQQTAVGSPRVNVQTSAGLKSLNAANLAFEEPYGRVVKLERLSRNSDNHAYRVRMEGAYVGTVNADALAVWPTRTVNGMSQATRPDGYRFDRRLTAAEYDYKGVNENKVKNLVRHIALHTKDVEPAAVMATLCSAAGVPIMNDAFLKELSQMWDAASLADCFEAGQAFVNIEVFDRLLTSEATKVAIAATDENIRRVKSGDAVTLTSEKEYQMFYYGSKATYWTTPTPKYARKTIKETSFGKEVERVQKMKRPLPGYEMSPALARRVRKGMPFQVLTPNHVLLGVYENKALRFLDPNKTIQGHCSRTFGDEPPLDMKYANTDKGWCQTHTPFLMESMLMGRPWLAECVSTTTLWTDLFPGGTRPLERLSRCLNYRNKLLLDFLCELANKVNWDVNYKLPYAERYEAEWGEVNKTLDNIFKDARPPAKGTPPPQCTNERLNFYTENEIQAMAATDILGQDGYGLRYGHEFTVAWAIAACTALFGHLQSLATDFVDFTAGAARGD